MNQPEAITAEYQTLSPLQIRLLTHHRYTVPPRDIDLDVILAADVTSAASPAAVEAASRITGVEATVADAQRLPYREAAFDVVCARHMLYHVPSPLAAIREAHRILRLGGCFAATVNVEGATAVTAGILDAALRRHGIEPLPAPNSLVNSSNLPGLVDGVFGNVTTLRVDNELVVPGPEPVIAYALSMLTLHGVPEDSPFRPAIAADVEAGIRSRFAETAGEGAGAWREPKGHVVCTARR